MRFCFKNIDLQISFIIYQKISRTIFLVKFLRKVAFSNASFDNFYRSISYVPGSMNYEDVSPRSAMMVWYPGLPFFLRSVVIWSQSIICSFVRLYLIDLTRVDFPVAIPPVSPMILRFLSFLPTKKMIKQGMRVLKKGLTLRKIYLAIQN